MVQFQFKIGKAFLNYPSHPITIPRTYYETLKQEGLAEDAVSIKSPFGNMTGCIVFGTSGWGRYYQIKVRGGYTNDAMSQFLLGQTITVELERINKQVCVTLQTA